MHHSQRPIRSTKRGISRRTTLLCLLLSLAGYSTVTADAKRPNILWLTSEDHGQQMGCYGDALARTPNIDALAAQGMRYTHAWSVAPVCSAARTAIITGVYPSSSGGLHHRSMVPIPADWRLHPRLLQDAGFYCTNNAKEDYNVVTAPDLWNESSPKAHWRNRPADRPFFAIFNSMRSHESQLRNYTEALVTDPQRVRIPAYHPDTPETRRDWARYYDAVSNADADAGARLRELSEAGLADDTVIFYFGDHGAGLPRSKRWPGDSGLRVPLIVYFPPKWRHLAPSDYAPGGASDRLVSFVDLAPTVLSIAGVSPPQWMQGVAFAGPFEGVKQSFLFGERGRMDERMDLARSISDGRYVYIRQFMPQYSQGQHNSFEFGTATTRVWRDAYDRGLCNDAQSGYWRTPRPYEELYDLQSDPDEVANLAASPEHTAVRDRLRLALHNHLIAVRDIAMMPEQDVHARSRGTSPYDVARDSARFPLDRIINAADLATGDRADALPLLVTMAADPDPAVRAWAVTGIRLRGPAAVETHETLLRSALEDSSAAVRIAAAEALGLYGSPEGLSLALEALRPLIEPATQGDFIARDALAAIDSLGERAAPLIPAVRALKLDDAAPGKRIRNSLGPLVRSITSRGGTRGEAP